MKFEDFPSSEQFSDGELKVLLEAFDKMMFILNLSIDLPQNMPSYFAYRLTINTLNEKTNIVNSEFCHFDFCTGYAPDCELKEYYPYLEVGNRQDDIEVRDIELDEDNLPF